MLIFFFNCSIKSDGIKLVGFCGIGGRALVLFCAFLIILLLSARLEFSHSIDGGGGGGGGRGGGVDGGVGDEGRGGGGGGGGFNDDAAVFDVDVLVLNLLMDLSNALNRSCFSSNSLTMEYTRNSI